MKINQGYGLEIGVSNGGHIRLEQKDDSYKPNVVLLTEHETRILIKELRRLLNHGAGKLVYAPEEEGRCYE